MLDGPCALEGSSSPPHTIQDPENTKPDALSSQADPEKTQEITEPILPPSRVIAAAAWYLETAVHEAQSTH